MYYYKKGITFDRDRTRNAVCGRSRRRTTESTAMIRRIKGCPTAQQNSKITRKLRTICRASPLPGGDPAAGAKSPLLRICHDNSMARLSPTIMGSAVSAIEAHLHIRSSARVGIVNDQVMKCIAPNSEALRKGTYISRISLRALPYI